MRSLTLFRDRLHAGPLDALALTLLLVVSPLFFGQSFHVFTDNPTWFFVVLGLERLFAYLQRPTFAGWVRRLPCCRHAHAPDRGVGLCCPLWSR